MILNVYSIHLEGSYSFVLLADNKEDAIKQYNYIFGYPVEDKELESFHKKVINEGTICSLGTLDYLTGELKGNICEVIPLNEVIKYGN